MSSDDDFAAMLEASLSASAAPGSVRLQRGQQVQGRVVQISDDTVFVDVGTRSEGQIARHELCDRSGQLQVSVGDKIKATVAQGGDRPHLVVALGRGEADRSMLEVAVEAKTPVEGTVSKVVKAGLEVEVMGIRAFCPASQVDISYTPDLTIYEGQTLQFRVIEVRDQGRSVVLSRKALLQAEREGKAQEVLSSLEVGSVVEGQVASLQKYGAFVELGGVQGLVHISEIAPTRIERVDDVLKIGEKVSVRILAIDPSEDPKRPKIRLSIKAVSQTAAPSVAAGQVLEAQVTQVESFGVFVKTEGGGAGLVPSRELDLPPGSDPKRAYPVGKKIRVVHLDDAGDRRRFSIKRVEDAEARQNYRSFQQESSKRNQKKSGDLGSLGELLKAKLKS